MMLKRLLILNLFLFFVIGIAYAQSRFCYAGAAIEIKGGGTTFSTNIEDLGESTVIRVSTRPLVTAYGYLVTDENNTIVKVATTNFIEIADLGAGIFRIWAFSYRGDIIAQPGQNAATVDLASFCSELTGNFITVEITGGALFQVQLLHHNDGESALIGSDEDQLGGVARFQQIIDEQRFAAFEGGYPSLLFSAGDNFLAGPEFTASIRQIGSQPLYDAIAHSKFGYDAIALGNHDFDFGPTILEEYITNTDPAFRPEGGEPQTAIGRLEFLGDFTLPSGFEVEGTAFGGISGIDYDSINGNYYLISDDSRNARYYTADIAVDENGIQSIDITSVTNLLDPEGVVFANGTVDPEAIRYDNLNNTLLWSSEGNISNAIAPAIREMNLDGSYLQDLTIPVRYRPDTTEASGPRQNGVFEALTLSVNGDEVISMLELPLIQDGVVPNIAPTDSPVRMVFFDRNSGTVTKEYAYPLDPVAEGGLVFQLNGVVEMLAVNETTFLVMERSAFFNLNNFGNIIRIFQVDVSEATDVAGIEALAGRDYIPVKKELLLTIDDNTFDLMNPVDNLEGMTFGPTLPNGNSTLVLVADDNFSSVTPQVNQFLAFEVFTKTVPTDGTAQNGAPPFLSANLDFTRESGLQRLVELNRIRKSTRIFRGDQVIGVIGLTTPELNIVSNPGNVEVLTEVAEVVAEEVATLKEKGVNKIILLSHLQSIDEEIALVARLKDIDIVIAGGGDEFLTNNPSEDAIAGIVDAEDAIGPYPLEVKDADGESVYLVTAPGSYNYLGNLTVTFSADGKVIEIDTISGPKKVITDKPDERIQEMVVNPVRSFVASLEANIIGATEPELNGARNDVRTRETNAGNLIADALLWQTNLFAPFFGSPPADVAIQNGGGIRNSVVIPAGSTISELTTFRMLPFPNFTGIVEPVTAEEFKQVMERAVSQVESARGQFAQIAGFEVVYDAAGQAQEVDENGIITREGNRIVSITLNDGTPIVSDGQIVEGAPAIRIATVDFLARGGDAYPLAEKTFINFGITSQQALSSYITSALRGNIFAAQYPEDGEGRIRTVTPSEWQKPRTLFSKDIDPVNITGYPNPFRNDFSINFRTQKTDPTEIFLTDTNGKRLITLFQGTLPTGQHQLKVGAKLTNLAEGIYLLTLKEGDRMHTISIVKQ